MSIYNPQEYFDSSLLANQIEIISPCALTENECKKLRCESSLSLTLDEKSQTFTLLRNLLISGKTSFCRNTMQLAYLWANHIPSRYVRDCVAVNIIPEFDETIDEIFPSGSFPDEWRRGQTQLFGVSFIYSTVFHCTPKGIGFLLYEEAHAIDIEDFEGPKGRKSVHSVLQQRNAEKHIYPPRHLSLVSEGLALHTKIEASQNNSIYGATPKLLADEFGKSAGQIRRHLNEARKKGIVSYSDNLDDKDVEAFREYMRQPGRTRRRKK